MNYFTRVKSHEVLCSPHTEIIVIDLNSIDISEYTLSHFVKLLVQLNI